MRPAIHALLLVLVATAGRSSTRDIPRDLTELSIEELMDIEVISASRKKQTLFSAAAAVFAITQEDIRRSGATSIPQALRMVPGLHVGRFDSNKWAISARGFNDVFANKLLILINGRSVYTPVFSGVFWEVQDVVLEDVERIEVVRGPGGTLWGANAVNGIINILTKEARDTRGGLFQAGSGSHERGFATARYGGRIGARTYFRVYAKYFQRRAFADSAGTSLEDDWHLSRGGGRMDWELSTRDHLTLQGDLYSGRVGQTLQLVDSLEPPFVATFADDPLVRGGHVLGRWKRRSTAGSDLELQLYYDRVDRRDRPVHGLTQTVDADFQHRFDLGRRQEVVWGLGSRFIRDDFETSTFILSIDPSSRDTRLFNLFLQDDLALLEERLHLIAGTKLEHNTYTGFELQPNLRFSWTPSLRHNVWGAISRAVRTPGRTEIDQRGNSQVVPPDQVTSGSPLTLISVQGNPDFESENLLAFDLGYRTRPGDGLTLDLAAFLNMYDDLRTNEQAEPFFEDEPAPRHLLIPLVIGNKLKGRTHGVELAASWQVLEWWRLQTAYTYLQMDMELKQGSQDHFATTWDQENPNHLLHLRSAADLPGGLGLDVNARYVDELPILNVDRYLAANIRLGWRPTDQVELFVVGQHLLAGRHPEFRRQLVISVPGEVEAGLYGALTWRF